MSDVTETLCWRIIGYMMVIWWNVEGSSVELLLVVAGVQTGAIMVKADKNSLYCCRTRTRYRIFDEIGN